MFLSRRTAQAEYFDSPERTPGEIRAAYRQLARVNRLFRVSHPFESHLPRWLGEERCRHLELLDLGGGDGTLARLLEAWSARRGWRWNITSVDLNALLWRSIGSKRAVVGDVLALPFRDASFDVVISSQMTHHLLDEAQIIHHFDEAWRVTRDAVMLTDLHRNIGLYLAVCVATALVGCTAPLRSDGRLSVARSFRVREWRALAERAGIPGADVSVYFGSRILLKARRR